MGARDAPGPISNTCSGGDVVIVLDVSLRQGGVVRIEGEQAGLSCAVMVSPSPARTGTTSSSSCGAWLAEPQS
jgi:hypothetical protein